MTYYKVLECDEKEATHKLQDACFVRKGDKWGPDDGWLVFKKIPRPKVVDLSSMIGDTVHLFEFSAENSTAWDEGYLHSLDPLTMGIKLSGEIGRYIVAMPHTKIRFQTDRWYPWFGGPCPLPEGVAYEKMVINVDTNGKNPHIELNTSELSEHSWNHANGFLKVIAYRPTGLAEGWVYSWEKGE